jgi:[pyruvate, water dikinase]-phosphate phosphotransferase / [pyruvate, water dikinase] kinase
VKEAIVVMQPYHIHLVSDSTGETVGTVARACLVQFTDFDVEEHIWPMVRTAKQVAKVVAGIKAEPGLVLYTLVNDNNVLALEKECQDLKVPYIGLLNPVIVAMGHYLGSEARSRPGRQHVMDAGYFGRIDAMQFVLSHDDGQLTTDLDQADVVIVGVSRSSKTPTCVYLANRGIKAANIPLVPGVPLPAEVDDTTRPLFVGLTTDAKSLVHLRRNRMRSIKEDAETDYTDYEAVSDEVTSARRLFAERAWPVIDVTRRSVEETATNIMQLLKRHREPPA